MKSNKNRTSVNAIRRINKKSEEAAKIWSEDEDEEIKSDILGSYTGNPSDKEKPVQDADDL
jgi:hypothetical protein